ncbi:hypothetical protein NG799_20915 [Laspinema sp. D1]|uniref:Uncharacterized protein n=1 Tax=Laspinema palackyanum D2a TaxID=2953684 RepID=A0ABT2MVJ8_9CYAN|nr:hypothetical protein [Laspinema sp. D2b]MCT7968774.1 hypothetical protein [Laspinema sp. D2a]
MVESRGDRPWRHRSDRLFCPVFEAIFWAIGNASSPHPLVYASRYPAR